MHKFDPITQEDYYALQAVFAGIGKGDIEYDSSSAVQKTRRDLERILSASNSKDRDILLLKQYQDIVKTWVIQQKESEVHWSPLQPNLFLSLGGATLTMQDDGTLFASGEVPDEERYTISAPVHPVVLQCDSMSERQRLPMVVPVERAMVISILQKSMHIGSRMDRNLVKLTIAPASADFDKMDGPPHRQSMVTRNRVRRYSKGKRIASYCLRINGTSYQKGGELAIALKQLHPLYVIGRFKLSVTDVSGSDCLTKSNQKWHR